MACLVRVKDCQHASARRLRGFDWSDECSKFRESAEVYTLNEVVRPGTAIGFELKCTVAGQSGASEPDYRTVTAEGDVLVDGSVEWTLQRVSVESLRKKISSSLWSVVPSGQMETQEPAILDANGEEKTSAHVLGGTTGETYQVINTVTFDDSTKGVGIYEIEVD